MQVTYAADHLWRRYREDGHSVIARLSRNLMPLELNSIPTELYASQFTASAVGILHTVS